jgi:predicted ATP-binding protein involved in virulence
MSNWLYKNKEINTIEDFPEGTFGFIYKVTYIPENITYIGKKSLYHNSKKKLGKKELEALPTIRGRKSSTKIVTKESDWKTYYGSAKPILSLLKEKKHDEFSREILQFVSSKKLLTYYECKYLFEHGVLEHPTLYFNDNILGKFFTRDFAPQD